jgi:hypothetical protein
MSGYTERRTTGSGFEKRKMGRGENQKRMRRHGDAEIVRRKKLRKGQIRDARADEEIR